MQSGEYDVVSASGDASLRLIAAGDVEPVNTDLMPNYADIWPFLKDQAWNTVDGVNYGVPHGWGANVLMYNTKEVKPAPTSWSAVFDEAEQQDGKVTAYDSPIYIADAALYLMKTQPDLGIENPYALDEDQLAAAVDLLKQQSESVGEYWSDYTKEISAFKTGSSTVGTTWQIIANLAKADGAPIDVVLPEEGATGWSDTWMVGAESEHKNCAYMWLDWIASPEVNAQVAEWFGEAPGNQKACDLTADPNHCDTFHAGDEEYADQIWYWTTPIEPVPRRAYRRRVHRLRRRGPRPGPRSRADPARGRGSSRGAPREPSALRRASAFMHRHVWLRLSVLLAAPMFWLLVVYVASLAALFITAFWTTDSFTSEIIRDWNLDNLPDAGRAASTARSSCARWGLPSG